MKKVFLLISLFVLLCLSACSNNISTDTVSESVPADYGKVIELAKTEFNSIFKEFDGLKIVETSTMTRTSDNSNVIVQISYSSNNGDGLYGFEFKKDDYENFEILQQGENVTIDNLIK